MSARSIVIAGSIAQKPAQGGHAWALLQWALGFRKLGWEVFWIDRLDREAAVDELGDRVPAEESIQLGWYAAIMSGFELESRCCLLAPEPGVRDGAESVYGASRAVALAHLGEAELLLNIMGFLDDAELLGAARRRVFLDIDPGFGQMWRRLELADLFAGHDDFVTVGRNIGRPECAIPDCEIAWIPTRPPVSLDHWPAREPGDGVNAFRTVATWRGLYAPIEYKGRLYGQRAHEFRRFANLPKLCRRTFEVALAIDEADGRDRDLLVEGGWELAEPRAVAGDPWSYRSYVADSAAELQIAKQIYVDTKSGWFSDRSACFLASGRPVALEDTGLAGDLPLGEGIVTFGTLDEAVAAVAEVDSDLPRHSRAARRIAEEHFAAERVIGDLLVDLGAASRSASRVLAGAR